MQKKRGISLKVKDLIYHPPQHWRALSQALINATRNCLLAVDSRGVIFLANTMAYEKFGAVFKLPLKDVIPELVGIVDKTIADGKRRMEISLQVKSGDYLTSISPVTLSGELAGVICLLEESTDLEKTAMKMRFFQNIIRELDAIIDSSSEGLFVCDARANVIRVNPASERIHNTEAKELIGKNMVDLIDQGFIDRSAALEASQSKTTVSLLQEKDNRKLISTGTPVLDDSGNLIRVVVSERDISEIDRLQRELEEQASLKDQLQHQLLEIRQTELKSNQIIARSPTMLRALERALKASSANSSVLITGGSGVGKGLIANLIHKNSSRSKNPFIRINCGAIPETLMESELFGYEAGAFTGAQTRGKPGSLELANGGSLFLDEIAELGLTAQVKLLRFLENGRLTRLGGSKVRTIDARILAATHRNLKDMVAKGTFRNDLYYRLNVIPLHLPALRERSDCIPPLIRYYIDYFADINDTRKRIGRSALDALLAYPYPGNVRELMNICERAVVMSETEVIDLQDLPKDVARRTPEPADLADEWPGDMTLKQILEKVERKVLLRTLEKYKNQSDVAAALGVSQPTIARRLKKHDIQL
ncbi:MAG: sigma 54-interacting transcriptional regulator [Desulfobacteraceae bacterium]|jgi:PAS domain S-box-containing protein